MLIVQIVAMVIAGIFQQRSDMFLMQCLAGGGMALVVGLVVWALLSIRGLDRRVSRLEGRVGQPGVKGYE